MRFLLFLVLAGAVLRAQTPVRSAPPSASNKSNPFEDDEVARRAGAKLYSRECAPCHGTNAEGIGKAPPLRQPEVYQAAPGVLFWVGAQEWIDIPGHAVVRPSTGAATLGNHHLFTKPQRAGLNARRPENRRIAPLPPPACPVTYSSWTPWENSPGSP